MAVLPLTSCTVVKQVEEHGLIVAPGLISTKPLKRSNDPSVHHGRNARTNLHEHHCGGRRI